MKQQFSKDAYHPSSETLRKNIERYRNAQRLMKYEGDKRMAMYLDKEMAPGSGEPDYFNLDNDPEYVAWVESQYD